MKPTIAITMGDPVGVGPEIILKALSCGRVKKTVKPVVIGDFNLLRHVAKRLKLKMPPRSSVINASMLNPSETKPGCPTVSTSKAMLRYVEEAIEMAKSKKADAVVTCPINKESAMKAGFRFPGHTEFIAHLTATKDFSMMLGGARLKVVLVTIHEPIKKIPKLISQKKILKTIRITDESFRRFFAVKNPRIAICGLNPHAGEGGLFGNEEKTIILPAVKKAQKMGINAMGPFPPDTIFFRVVQGEFDCVICMYHDQGLIPLKLLHFKDAVNVTLGLPIIRTSVDHGTGYDIAWKGIAKEDSLISAIELARDMARKRVGD